MIKENKYLVKKEIGEIFKVNMFGEQVTFLNDIYFTTKNPLETLITKDDIRTQYIWKFQSEDSMLSLKDLIK